MQQQTHSRLPSHEQLWVLDHALWKGSQTGHILRAFQYYCCQQSKECIFDSPNGEFSISFFEMNVPVAELNPSCAGPSGMGISLFLIYSPVCHCSPSIRALQRRSGLICLVFYPVPLCCKNPSSIIGCLTFSLCILNSIWSCQIKDPKWMPNPTSLCAVQVSSPLKSHHEAHDKSLNHPALLSPSQSARSEVT